MIAGSALLFCPGDRPDRYEKALDRADAVIIDLEDAVAFGDKAAARAALIATPLDPARVIVRVNPRSSEFFADDFDAVQRTNYRKLMLPKAETSTDLRGLEGYEVMALCETPLGVQGADALAADPRVAALTWGAEDLVAAIGGFKSRTPDGRFGQVAEYARSRVLIAAAAAGKPAYDTVHPDLADDAGLRAEAAEAAAAGFRGAMCLHPRQVEILRDAYRPDARAVEWASGVLAAAAEAPSGVFAYNGQMIDEPLLRQARRIAEVARE
ncbi:HpcH/HpaI aldolase/citrate lyase family protein [Leucobacter albus]|uniref:HpcH/HpaI aldolase/citrate lyase family protein n=1 Tax=Leucobacter albus TaxID=272210 RepID=A0ABW3TNB3_9MICO